MSRAAPLSRVFMWTQTDSMCDNACDLPAFAPSAAPDVCEDRDRAELCKGRPGATEGLRTSSGASQKLSTAADDDASQTCSHKDLLFVFL